MDAVVLAVFIANRSILPAKFAKNPNEMTWILFRE